MNIKIGYLPNYFQSKYINSIKTCENEFKAVFNSFFKEIKWSVSSQINCISNQIEVFKLYLTDIAYPVVLREIIICPELQRMFYKFECVHENNILASASVYTPLINIFNCNYNYFNVISNYFAYKYNISNPKFYHTISHVEYMLKNLRLYVNNLSNEDFKTLYLTIVFHDVLYKAGENNETLAINTVKNVLWFNKIINDEQKNKICDLINTTRIGTSIEKIKSIYLADILHDLDYLSFSNPKFLKTTDKIYNEYKLLKYVDKKEFYLNRIDFLKNLLLNFNEQIFLTKYFKSFNNIAIQNIKTEIGTLTKKL
jgi:predicted metal-dependent HD superfamily phosphohydrolase